MDFVGQLPGLPHRLTRLYSDSKHSADAVTEKEHGDDAPELSSLRRKFRIQKDRYIAWGLEWSDDNKGSIDESVGRAGVTDTVSSVMSTIKEIYSEAEQLMQNTSDKKAIYEKTKAFDDSKPLRQATDLSKYEELYKDLEKSIDILYELSRTRRALRAGHQPTFATPEKLGLQRSAKDIFLAPDYSASAETLVNSVRTPTGHSLVGPEHPPKLSFSDLILPGEEPPPYHAVYETSPPSRIIARLKTPAPSGKTWRIGGRQNSIPVLIEYAPFDPAYRETGIAPPSDRLEGFLNYLARNKAFAGQEDLNCRGYFEDPEHPQIGLVYELPSFVQGHLSKSTQSRERLKPASLLQLLQSPQRGQKPNSLNIIPPLEVRFRLARRIVASISRLHEDGLVHKNLNSGNILIFQDPTVEPRASMPGYNLSSPFLSSFDFYSEYNLDPIEKTTQHPSIYRHPTDPFVSSNVPKRYTWQHDLYALGLILLEIGMWTPIADLFKSKYTLEDFKHRALNLWTRKLSGKCGSLYMRAVEECLLAADRMSSEAHELPRQAYDKILSRLQRCCLLDDTEPISSSVTSSTTLTPPLSSHLPLNRTASDPAPASRRTSISSDSTVFSEILPIPPDLRLISQPLASKYLSVKLPLVLEDDESVTSPRDGKDSVFSRPRRITPSSWDDNDNLSIASITSRYKAAAKIIQRAWRARKEKITTFDEYKEKVTVIQTRWRERCERLTTSSLKAEQRTRQLSTSPTLTRGPELVIEEQAIQTQIQPTIRTETVSTKPKLRLHQLKLPQESLDEWHYNMLPQLERIVGRALKDSPETVSIDLVSIGETQFTARPTIFVTCSSTGRVKSVLARKFNFDSTMFDLKVRKGKIRRSKVSRSRSARKTTHRSMGYSVDYPVRNPFHYERPLCGASIGAYIGEHLPPVSYGGVVLVDGQPYGMSVHHLLDAPSEDEVSEFEGEESYDDVARSSASRPDHMAMLAGMGAQPSFLEAPELDYPLEITDESDNALSDEDFDTDELFESDSDDDMEDMGTQGDISGIAPGEGAHILITQPAIDDVDADFFPCEDDRDDEHLSSHKLGHVHASSGIRRWNRNGVVHEIDWALLKLDDNRMQPYNLVQGGKRYCSKSSNFCPNLIEPVNRQHFKADEDEYPCQVARADTLGNTKVHCFGRTSGLQGGIISEAMSSLKIYKRGSFSRSWHVVGNFGVGGDSGAWVIENHYGRVCGHVLAFCESRKLAYICPMEVLLEDIKRTLGAKKVCLPGGEIEDESRARTERDLLVIRDSMEGLGLPTNRSRSPVLGIVGNAGLASLDGRLRAA